MMQLRLFRAAEPFQPLDERCLSDGELVVGRDSAADWPIADDTCELSRRHCVFSVRDNAWVLRDVSANGVFVGEQRRRVEKGTEIALAAHESIYLGQFLIVIEPAETEKNDQAFADLFKTTASVDAFSVRDDWASDSTSPANDQAPRRPLTDAALLEAFCTGAGIDASSFLSEDPAAVLERAGAMYKQMVLGVSDLLSERHAIKSDLEMDRTTVGAADNNPFKWAPTRRVATDLLRDRKDGFLSGPAALKASFEDLRKHALCLMAGSRASVDHVLMQLAPQVIDEEARQQGGLRLNRAEACWRILQARHTELADENPTIPNASVNSAFRQGYVRELHHLEEVATKS